VRVRNSPRPRKSRISLRHTAFTTIYDGLGRLKQTQQGSQTRTSAYDGLGRVMSTCSPETGPSNSTCGTTYIYYTNTSGGYCAAEPTAVCRSVDPASITTTYTYDPNTNRMKQYQFKGGSRTGKPPPLSSAESVVVRSHGRLERTLLFLCTLQTQEQFPHRSVPMRF
jgi:hypothetical protein